MDGEMDEETQAALRRLLSLATGDTGGGRVAANFLLAWWNAAELGGFDLTEMWQLDDVAARDMVLLFAFVSQNNVYPDVFIERSEIATLISRWRRPDSPAT